MSKVKRACMVCGRMISVKYAIQNNGGGKQRVRHLCPHGVVCITGVGPTYGTSSTGAPPIAGPNSCKECGRRKFLELHGMSGNFPEIPAEEKRKELN